MTYLAFEEKGECYLLVNSAAIERHPVFFANLLSSCVTATDAQGRRLDALDVWQAVAAGHWQALLARYRVVQAPSLLQAAVRPGVLALKRSVSRYDGICTIFRECDAVVWVHKYSHIQGGRQTLPGQPIFSGVAYDIYLRQLAARGDWLAWLQAVQRFIEKVFSRFALNADILRGAAVDAVARNAILDDQGEIVFFDLECAEYTTPRKTFFIYRLCCSLVGRNAEYLTGSGFICLYELYFYLCAHFSLDARAYIEDVRCEADFQAWISGQSIKRVKYFKGLKPFALKQPMAQKLRQLRYALRLLAARYR